MDPAVRNSKAVRIAERLRAQIVSGQFPGRSLLPTERELCRRHDASRETVRRSLRFLVAEGLVTRIPARGVAVVPLPAARSGAAVQIAVLTAYPYEACNYYYHGILTGLVEGSHRTGLPLSFQRRTPHTDLLAAGEGAATIVWPAEPGDLPALRRLAAAGRRFVVMSASFDDDDLPCEDCDNAVGTALAMDHLLDRSHRRIGLVARSPRLSLDHAQRVAGTTGRLGAVPPLFRPRDGLSPESYAASLARWIRRERLTAVFTMDLEVALTVYAACARAGLAIPADLSIVSFDDSVLAEVCTPPLTTVAQPLNDIGMRAVERLAAALREGQPCRGTERLETRLVERQSVAPA